MQTKPISFRTKYYVIASVAWQSPGRDTLLTPRKILLYLRGKKGAHKQKSEHYLPDNAISKVQCAPWGKTIPPQSRWYCLLMCLGLRNYGL